MVERRGIKEKAEREREVESGGGGEPAMCDQVVDDSKDALEQESMVSLAKL